MKVERSIGARKLYKLIQFFHSFLYIFIEKIHAGVKRKVQWILTLIRYSTNGTFIFYVMPFS